MLISIVYKPTKGDKSDGYTRVPLQEALLVEGHGIKGDLKGKGKRQLNVLSERAVRSLAQDGFLAQPGQLGEQLIIAGIDIEELPVGSILQIGDHARIELLELRTGCDRFEAYQSRKRQEAARRLGMMARVATGGLIRVGDAANVIQTGNAECSTSLTQGRIE